MPSVALDTASALSSAVRRAAKTARSSENSSRPDPSAFDFGRKISGTCADNVCDAYRANLMKGYHPIQAFEGWVN